MAMDKKVFQQLLEWEELLDESDLFEARCGYDALMADVICEMQKNEVPTELLDELDEKVLERLAAEADLAYYYGYMKGLRDASKSKNERGAEEKEFQSPNEDLLFSTDGKCVLKCFTDAVKVEIPEGVTHIGARAFADCYYLEEVVLPESLRVVGKEAFAGCLELSIPSLPEELRIIGERAFLNCSIRMCCLWEVRQLGAFAFEGCTLPNGIVIIGDDLWLPNLNNQSAETYLFGEESSWYEGQCASIGYKKYSVFDLSRKIHFEGRNMKYRLLHEPDEVIVQRGDFKIRNRALLAYTGKDTVVHLPKDIRYIEAYAFVDAEQIRELYLPETLGMVGEGAFAPLTELTDLYVYSEQVDVFRGIYAHASMNPLRVHVKKDSFSDLAYENECEVGCHFAEVVSLYPFSYHIDEYGTLSDYEGSLREFTVPNGVIGIGKDCFLNSEYLEKVDLPATLFSIGNGAFAELDLKEIQLPQSLRLIGKDAFKNSSLQKVNLPKDLRMIDEGAFEGTNLEEITIPENITFIGSCAFYNYGRLKEVTCLAMQFQYGEDIFHHGKPMKLNCLKCSDILDVVADAVYTYYDEDKGFRPTINYINE